MTIPRLLVLLALVSSACGGVLHGRVFIDHDGDRIRDPDEPGVPGVRVFFESAARARTDAAGDYILATPFPLGIVWAWTPDGYRPGPSYAHVRDADGVVDIPLAPFAGTSPPPSPSAPWSFAVASDSHVVIPVPDKRWDGGDLLAALTQALAPAPRPPVFLTILGDITQSARQPQLDVVIATLERFATPFVAVSGNHDLHDDGHAWRTTWGPDAYGFDLGGLRFVVWNGFVDNVVQLELLHLALDGEDPAARIVGLGHASPRDVVVRDMAALGIDYLLTGHWHSNRRVDRFGLTEWGTEPLIMGGLDHSPAGYRIVTVDGGRLTTTAPRTLLAPVLALAAPVGCAGPGPVDVVAVAALDAGTPAVTARWIDADVAAPPVALAPRGGWAHAGTLPAIGGAPRTAMLTATTPGGGHRELRATITPCEASPATSSASARTSTWSQIGGGPDHAGASRSTAIDLAPAWTAIAGGHVLGGSPIAAGDTVYITVTDLADGDRGGVVALALATGRERWRFVTPRPARGAVAVARGVVVIPESGGTVYGVDAATGRERWRRDLAAGTDSWTWHLWQPPLIVGDTVYIGTQTRFAALDVETGTPRWTTELPRLYPWLGTSAAATQLGDELVFVADREDGLWIGDRATGTERIALESADFLGIAGAPIAADGRLYIGNSFGDVLALEPASFGVYWRVSLVAAGFDWSESMVASLALADGRVFAATQAGELAALDAVTGTVLWRAATAGGPINAVHYAADGVGYSASPVVTGDIVWIGGPDGVLIGRDVATGRERERHVLGSPILAGAAPVDGGLVVATFAGTVHLLATPRHAPPPFPWQVVPGAMVVFAALVAVVTASSRTPRSRRDRAARRS